MYLRQRAGSMLTVSPQTLLVELREFLVAPLRNRLTLGVGLPHDPGGLLYGHPGNDPHEYPDV